MARILLIEPDSALAEIYQAALKQAGHKVHVEHGAQAAIQAADKHSPDLIILELQLAAHNGIEFMYELRSYPDWQTTPVIINSLVPPGEFSGNTLFWQELGIAAYAYKPRTSLERLLKLTRDVLAAQPAHL